MPEGRSVLVTGADRGIGRAIAEAFVAAGDKVVGTYRTGRPEDVPEGAVAVRADVTDTTSVDAAFSRAEELHGPVEVLVANAGVTRDALLMRATDDDFSTVLDTNLGGAHRCARRAAKGMVRLKRGRIVLIGSVVGLYGSPGQASYAASKAALVGLARALTRELGGRGITTNVVAPGYISTAMTDALPEAQQKAYQDAIPASRFGAAEEVAGAVVFLASDAAGYISGAVVPVDGGLGMGH